MNPHDTPPNGTSLRQPEQIQSLIATVTVLGCTVEELRASVAFLKIQVASHEARAGLVDQLVAENQDFARRLRELEEPEKRTTTRNGRVTRREQIAAVLRELNRPAKAATIASKVGCEPDSFFYKTLRRMEDDAEVREVEDHRYVWVAETDEVTDDPEAAPGA